MLLLPYLLAIVAGFVLLNAPIAGTFLAGIEPLLHVIGLLAVIVFSLVIIIYAVLNLLKKYRK